MVTVQNHLDHVLCNNLSIRIGVPVKFMRTVVDIDIGQVSKI